MRNKVFISYSHADEAWLRRLQVHLKSLDEDIVLPWDDTRIKPGQDWRREIREAIDTAAAAVLLVSADFLASKFIKDNELPPLLDAAEEDGVTILPVILKPCRFRQTPGLERFQTVNDPDHPMVDLGEGQQERVWNKTVDCIETAVRQASPEARREADLARIREEVRTHLNNRINNTPYLMNIPRALQEIDEDLSLSTADKREYQRMTIGIYADEIILILGNLLTDCTAEIAASTGSGLQRRRLNNRLQAISHELDRWFEIRKQPGHVDEAISQLLK